MHSGEFSGNSIPHDELAPNLAMIWGHEPHEPQHFTALLPDPEATIDMRIWAKLFAQMKAFDQWSEATSYGQLPDQNIVVNFPTYGVWVGDKADVWVNLSFNQFETDGPYIVGQTGFTIVFDMTRPGFARAHESMVAHPENIKPNDTLAESVLIRPADEGLYMASDGSSVGYRFAEYSVTQPTAEKISNLLSEASLSDETVQRERFNRGLEMMDLPVKEAIHRHFILRKSLVRSPEETFKPTVWRWCDLPSQHALRPNQGIYVEHWDRVQAYAPPGGRPCDGYSISDFTKELNDQGLSWIRATWIKDELPDDFFPLFEEPSSLETLSPEEVLQTIPDDIKKEISYWVQDNLFWRQNWMDDISRSIDSIVDITEDEFADRKKKHDEKGEHFYWGLHTSLRSCIRTALHSGGSTIEEWISEQEILAQDYADIYTAYKEVIDRFPHDKYLIGSSIWSTESERVALYEKASRAYQRLEELPEDKSE